MTGQQFNFLYQQAKKLMDKTKDANHDWSHIERVTRNALEIKKLLPKDKQQQIDNKILIIACAWHDISFVFYKAGFIQYFLEAKRSIKILDEYFDRAKIKKEEKELIKDIILHHTFSDLGFKNKNKSLYHQILQDADFVDEFSNERIKTTKILARKNLFWLLVVKILKPLFFNSRLKNKQKFLNLKQSIKVE